MLSFVKYRKLKFNFQAFLQGDFDEIIAFGGAFSNLLYTLSFIVRKAEIPSTFYIRGDGYDPHNPSMSLMADNGVRLRFVDRKTYRRKAEPEVLEQLLRGHSKPYIVPEGGSNRQAIPGSAEILEEIIKKSSEQNILKNAEEYLMMINRNIY